MCAFPNHFRSVRTVSGNMRKARGQCGAGWAENSAAGGINCRGRRTVPDTKTPYFIGFYAMAWRLLILGFRGEGRALRRLSEFCHAVCSWRRVVRTGRHPIVDLIGPVVVAIDRL